MAVKDLFILGCAGVLNKKITHLIYFLIFLRVNLFRHLKQKHTKLSCKYISKKGQMRLDLKLGFLDTCITFLTSDVKYESKDRELLPPFY